MKTLGIIVIVFFLGLFGWFNFNHREEKKILPKKEDLRLKIVIAENECSRLELKIQSKQIELDKQK